MNLRETTLEGLIEKASLVGCLKLEIKMEKHLALLGKSTEVALISLVSIQLERVSDRVYLFTNNLAQIWTWDLDYMVLRLGC